MTVPKSKKSLRARLLGLIKQSREDALRGSIKELLEEESQIQQNEKMILANALKLRDVVAQDVMVPRADISAIPVDMSPKELIEYIGKYGHSRYPVFRETLDDTLGIVHIKDILPLATHAETFSLRKIVRKVLFVSPSIHALDLLTKMQLERVHMALVVDEHGGIDGLITIEDLVEEIVGEIQDEHAMDFIPELSEQSDGSSIVDARYPIKDFENTFGGLLTKDERLADIETLGGLVCVLAGRVPLQGELITHSSGVEFEIIAGDLRRIRSIRIIHPKSG